MKTFLFVLLTGSALAVMPASANSTDQALQGLRDLLGQQAGQSTNPADRDLLDRESRIADLIRESHNQGRLDDRQTDRAFAELRAIRSQESDLRARDGGQLSGADQGYLQGRLASLDHKVDSMREANLGSEGSDRPRYAENENRDSGWGGAPRDPPQREQWLEQRIHDRMDDSTLSRSDGARELRQLRSIRITEANFMKRDEGDLSDEHRAILDRRLDALTRDLRDLASNDR